MGPHRRAAGGGRGRGDGLLLVELFHLGGRPGSGWTICTSRPQHRRHGLGNELLSALRARTDGRVEWDMQEGNDRAAAFYGQLGAQPVPGWIRYRWSPEVRQG